MCGENYLGQNTNRVTFGLGSSLAVDSLKILWPSGYQDMYYDLDHGYLGTFLEGASYQTGLEPTGEVRLCEGDSLMISAGSHANYLWNTLDTTQLIQVVQPGVYTVTTSNMWGFEATDSLLVIQADLPVPDYQVTDVSCSGEGDGSVQFNYASDLTIYWQFELSDSLITDLPPGDYSFMLEDSLGCALAGEVSIVEPDPLELSLDELWCEEGLNALVSTVGGTPPYIWEWSNGVLEEDLLAAVDSLNYSLTVSDQNNCSAQLDDVECALFHRAIAQPTLTIYPNPSNGMVYIEGGQPQFARLVDSKGRMCMEMWISGNCQLELSTLPKGVYLLRLIEGDWRILRY
jgi:hypothetical protein